MIRKRPRNGRQLLRSPPVIPIEESDYFAMAVGNSMVESGSLTAIGFAKNTDLGGELGKNFRRAVRGAVVHHQNFPLGRGEILRQHALNRFLDEALVVVRIDQYADERRGHQQSGILSGSKHS